MAGVRRLARWLLPMALGAVIAVLGLTILATRQEADPVTTEPQTATTTARGDPAVTARAFLDAWAASDWTALETLVAGDGGAANSAHASWWNDLQVQSVAFALGDLRTDTARVAAPYTVDVTVGDHGRWEYQTEMWLVPAGDDWAVDWSPTVLHPSLNAGGHFTLVTTWPDRAAIRDVLGRPMAESAPAVAIGIIPGRVEADRSTLHAGFEDTLGIQAAQIDAVVDREDAQPDWFLPVTTVSREDYVEVRPALHPIPGVAFRIQNEGTRSASGTAAMLVGATGEITAELLTEYGDPYTARLIVGRSGLERAFERRLAGTPSVTVVRRTPSGPDAAVHTFTGETPEPLQTTLSLDVQRAAEAVLADIESPAALVAIDAATGEIRAAASVPAPGFNRALSGRYPPGSTFKIVVAAALLEAGLGPDDTVACPDVVTVGGKEFRNAASLPSTMTLEEAFARSCNTAFIQLGQTLEPAAIAAMAARFGFGAELEPGLPSAGGSFTIADDPVADAASFIGQGEVLSSPLHMASVAATAASGQWHAPTLVAEASTAEGRALGADVAADLQLMMRAVVVRGTGRDADVDGREVAGKTGTAQLGTGDETVAWFVGYADDLAFAVAVEGEGSGGSTAAPLARRFLEALDGADAPDVPTGCVPARADWTTFQGGAERLGCSEAEPIVQARVKWAAEVGIQAWLNSPVVAGDTVVVGSAGTRRAGSDDADGIYALALDDGSRRWFFPTNDDVNGVAVAGDLVVATGDEGAVWGIDLATGSERWVVDAGTNVFTNPLLVDDIAVVGDATGDLLAIDVGDGTVRWQGRLNGAIRGGAAASDGLIYVASDLGEAKAFTRDGFEMWHTVLERSSPTGVLRLPVYATPTVVDDLVVFTFLEEGGGFEPSVVALDRYLGTIEWWGIDSAEARAERWANVRNSAALAGGDLVIGTSLSSGPQAVTAATGEVSWEAVTDVTCGRQWASAVVMGDLVVQARPDGAVYGFNVDDGMLQWRLAVSSPGEIWPPSTCTSFELPVSDGFAFEATPAVAPDGTLIVATTGQFIYAIEDAG